MNEKSTAGANTIAEILSEPATWKSCLESLEKTGELKSLNEKLLKNVEWVFVGCGSSFYLAQAAASSWAILTGVRSRAIPASEIMLFPELFPLPCQPVLISRSGYTSEVLQVAEYLERKLKVRTLAITCGKDTPFEKIASHRIKSARRRRKKHSNDALFHVDASGAAIFSGHSRKSPRISGSAAPTSAPNG